MNFGPQMAKKGPDFRVTQRARVVWVRFYSLYIVVKVHRVKLTPYILVSWSYGSPGYPVSPGSYGGPRYPCTMVAPGPMAALGTRLAPGPIPLYHRASSSHSISTSSALPLSKHHYVTSNASWLNRDTWCYITVFGLAEWVTDWLFGR